MALDEATRGRRLAIAIFGRVNAGKSSLLNYLTGQAQALVSPTPGTTTDAVEKAMEIPNVGASLFIDTPGFADDSPLGALRQKAMEAAIDRADIAIVLFADGNLADEIALLKRLAAAETPIIPVISRADEYADGGQALAAKISADIAAAGLSKAATAIHFASAARETGRDELFATIEKLSAAALYRETLTGDLCAAGDTVLLVMPQDIEAPVGRLILPQVETIRELLDKHCVVIAATAGEYQAALSRLKEPPKLIITDSQVFKTVYAGKPAASLLTSFSILFAAQKGDLGFFVESAKRTLGAGLKADAKILIAESCTHVPVHEDIGRVKIPHLLRQKFGGGLQIGFVNGRDFPAKLAAADYDLIIHCGACMFNRKLVMSRVAKAKAAGVPMTNYGIAIATLTGIIDKVALPLHHSYLAASGAGA